MERISTRLYSISSEQLIKIMFKLYKLGYRNLLIKVMYIRLFMKVGIVLLAKHMYWMFQKMQQKFLFVHYVHERLSKLAEESYFFRLSAYQDRLLAFYEKNPDFIVPRERAKEVINFVKSGLRDLSISRTTILWGIPFPGDSKHVTYVWADALNNYITAIGYGQPNKQEEFNYWWPADVQVLGKDIIRFHAIYWPAFLMASELAMPKQLLVHGWIKVDNEKMSKSRNNVVDPQELAQTYGVDQIRYFLMRQMSIGQDSNFAISECRATNYCRFANDLGNLLNRLTALLEKQQIFNGEPSSTWGPEREVCTATECPKYA